MKIILASTSPRRLELMRQVGLACKVFAPDADETPLRNETPAHLVARLARAKASSVVPRVLSGDIVIAADTIVIDPSGRKILGKPRNARDAEKMLGMLAGKKHVVLTGYCIIKKRPKSDLAHVRVVKSLVQMRSLTSSQIRAYIATGEPMDKAGSYAAQGLGMALIEGIGGSYANVVGLPVCQLWMDLEKHFGLKAISK